MATNTKQSLPKPAFTQTNGFLLKRLKTFSDASKWFLGGVIAILLITYDKIDGNLYKIGSFLIAVVGITCLSAAYLGFKRYADYLENLIESEEKRSSPATQTFRDGLPVEQVWPTRIHRWFYIPGLLSFILYAVLIFIAIPFLEHQQPKSNVVNNYYYMRDSAAAKPH